MLYVYKYLFYFLVVDFDDSKFYDASHLSIITNSEIFLVCTTQRYVIFLSRCISELSLLYDFLTNNNTILNR